ncbi:MAG: hypothetical protein V1929_08750 [bacterium]
MSQGRHTRSSRGEGSVRPLVCAAVVFVGLLILLIPLRSISAPTWWGSRGVIN